jgi:hypothetical protein
MCRLRQVFKRSLTEAQALGFEKTERYARNSKSRQALIGEQIDGPEALLQAPDKLLHIEWPQRVEWPWRHLLCCCSFWVSPISGSTGVAGSCPLC